MRSKANREPFAPRSSLAFELYMHRKDPCAYPHTKNFAWDFVIIRHLIYANVYFFRSFVISFRLKLDCSVCICIVTAVLYSNDGNPMASSKEYLQAWTDVAIKKRRKCKSIHIQILKVLVEAAATTHTQKKTLHTFGNPEKFKSICVFLGSFAILLWYAHQQKRQPCAL